MDLDTAFEKIKNCCNWPSHFGYYRLTRRLKNGEFEELEMWADGRHDANLKGQDESPHDDDTTFEVERLG